MIKDKELNFLLNMASGKLEYLKNVGDDWLNFKTVGEHIRFDDALDTVNDLLKYISVLNNV